MTAVDATAGRDLREPVIGPETVSREAHFFPGPHLVLTAEPLAQPPGRVSVNRLVGRADLSQDEVVRPAGQQPVQAFHHDPRRQAHVSRRRQLAHTTADALDARPTRTGADVEALGILAVVRWRAAVAGNLDPDALKRGRGRSEKRSHGHPRGPNPADLARRADRSRCRTGQVRDNGAAGTGRNRVVCGRGRNPTARVFTLNVGRHLAGT